MRFVWLGSRWFDGPLAAGVYVNVGQKTCCILWLGKTWRIYASDKGDRR